MRTVYMTSSGNLQIGGRGGRGGRGCSRRGRGRGRRRSMVVVVLHMDLRIIVIRQINESQFTAPVDTLYFNFFIIW
jgi:hypothetical protein